MKSKFYSVALVSFSLLTFSLTKLSNEEKTTKSSFKNSHLAFSSGSPSSRSGAPGESNCTACHNGTVQSGAGITTLTLLDANQQVVTSYTPNETYTVVINTEASTKRGFQASARILSSNAKAGNSVAVAGSTSVVSASNQQFVNHTIASSSSTNDWTFTWTAPSTNVGDVRFYVASNTANNNGQDSGDIIRTSQHTISGVSGASIENQEKNSRICKVAYDNYNNAIAISFENKDNADYHINLIDLNGKSVFNKRLNNVIEGENNLNISLPQELKAGLYVVHFFENNNSISKKIMIAK